LQVIAAILTLGAMLYLGYKQNKMTRRQINLSLYEKRYELYNDIRDFLYKNMRFDYVYSSVHKENDMSKILSDSICDKMRYLISIEDQEKLEEILVEQIGAMRKKMVEYKYHPDEAKMVKKRETLQADFREQKMLMHSRIDMIFDRYINFKDI
jgi:hypothetical protein